MTIVSQKVDARNEIGGTGFVRAANKGLVNSATGWVLAPIGATPEAFTTDVADVQGQFPVVYNTDRMPYGAVSNTQYYYDNSVVGGTITTTVTATPIGKGVVSEEGGYILLNIGLVSGGSTCDLDTLTQPQADTLTLEDLRVTVCGTGDPDIDGKTVTLDKVSGLFGPTLTAPVMGGVGTTNVSNITTTAADLTGTFVSDGGSPVTATGFVVYPSGNPSTVIGGVNVLQFPDGTLPSPITSTATGLTDGTNYCVKPYATNGIGTSYGDEECFTTLAIAKKIYVTANNGNMYRVDINTATLEQTWTSAQTGGTDLSGAFSTNGSNFVYYAGTTFDRYNILTNTFSGGNIASGFATPFVLSGGISLGSNGSQITKWIGGIQVASIPALVGPFGAVAEDANYYYVTGGQGSTNIYRITKDFTSITSISLGGMPYAMYIIDGYIYVGQFNFGAGSNIIYIINQSTFTLNSTISVANIGSRYYNTNDNRLYGIAHRTTTNSNVYAINTITRLRDVSKDFVINSGEVNTHNPMATLGNDGFVYLVSEQNSRIIRITLATNAVNNTFVTGLTQAQGSTLI